MLIRIIPFLLSFVLPLSIGSEPIEKTISCEKIQSEFFIRDFYIKDFSRNLFYLEVKTTDKEKFPNFLDIDADDTKDSEYPKIKKVKFITKIEEAEGDRIRGSYSYHKGSSVISYELSFSENNKPGPICVRLYDEKYRPLSSFLYNLPDRMEAAGKQPLILKITPNGGVPGETITILGKNFQNNMDHMFIQIISEDQDDYEYGDKELVTIQPFFLSPPDEKQVQELKFTIPTESTGSYKFYEKLIGKNVKMKLLSNYRPSTTETLVILKPYWKWVGGILTIIVTMLFILSISFLLKKFNFTHEILLDPKTNSYSLANFQSFAWTIVFLGSYFYVAISAGIILNTSELPDFNFSLIGLMGISYGGLLTSSYLDKRKTEITFYKDKPELKDLISDPNGGIDLSRLQLLGFTLITIIVYIFYLFKANVLNGLPGIPETLHTMLLTSQGGFLGNKAIELKKDTKDPEAGESPNNPEKAVAEAKEV